MPDHAYGWGIRWTPRGWLWNVSGLDVFPNRDQRPDELAAALRQVIA